MANSCYFLMKIAGREDQVQEFLRMLQWTGPYENSGLGWVYSFEVDEDTLMHSPKDKNIISLEGQGDCAWSLKTALQDFAIRPLLQETQRLGLMVEAYSSEPGLEFQEHILIDRGTLLLEDGVLRRNGQPW